MTALVLPASADAAVKTYKGKIEEGGKIEIDVKVKRGVPKEVLELRLKKFPYKCTTSGNVVLDSTISALSLTVTEKKFVLDSDDSTGGHVLFKGTFKHDGKDVLGKIQRTVTGVTPGNQTCRSKKRDYSADR
jgi:hypothetical protein